MTQNSSFSQSIPGLQIAWDSTSLGALKTCPRYYQYSIIEGWTPRILNVHLKFGLVYHGALERYDHARSAGADHESALRVALRYALAETWDSRLNRPWASDEPNKNRYTLIRTIVWYLDEFGESDPVATVQLANGKPAIELSFRFELNKDAPSGEPYLLCGHLDKIGVLNDQHYVVDRKTTKSTVNQDYFAGYTPDNQFSLYSLASRIVWGEQVQGIIVDAAQIAVSFSRFQRGLVQRTESQLAEWHQDLGYWIGAAESYAYHQRWPQNDKACFRCQFRSICATSPETRGEWLAREFHKRVWDPLVLRGDI